MSKKSWHVAVHVIVLLSLVLSSCTPAIFSNLSVPLMMSLPDEKALPKIEADTYQIPAIERPVPRIGVRPQNDPTLSANNKQSPVAFIENVGQFDKRARFQAKSNGATIYFSENAIWFTLLEPLAKDPNEEKKKDVRESVEEKLKKRKGVNLKINLIGSNHHPNIEPLNAIETKLSYFNGQKESDWYPNVPVWSGIRYVDVFPGMDLEITGNDEQLFWEFLITDSFRFYDENAKILEGGIRIKITGHKKLQTKKNAIDIGTDVGVLPLPLIRFNGNQILPQENNNGDLTIPIPDQRTITSDIFERIHHEGYEGVGQGVLASLKPNNMVRSNALGSDPPKNTKDLLIYSTFLGGSDHENYNSDGAIAIDQYGNVYLAGYTYSVDFPTTPGAFQQSKKGDYDAVIAKIDPDSGDLIFATYLGGDSIDAAQGIAVDSSENVYVVGFISGYDEWDSNLFPIDVNALDSECSPDPVQICFDEGFLTKLSPNGDSIIYSTFLGGTHHDWAGSVLIDDTGFVYVSGTTQSLDFPSPGTGYHQTLSGESDVFVTKINPAATQMEYFTYIGGTDFDGTNYGMTLDDSNAVFLTGYTYSNDFPTTVGPGFQGGSQEAFALKLNPSGESLDYSRFLGGSGTEEGYGIAVDQEGSAYIAIELRDSNDFPVTKVFGTPTDYDATVTKLNPTGTNIVYSTRFTSAKIKGVSVDDSGYAYFVGHSYAIDHSFPTFPYSYDPDGKGDPDIIIGKLTPPGDRLAYSTYLGGSSSEYAASSQAPIDSNGNIYILSTTYSDDYPTTDNAFDRQFNGDPLNYPDMGVSVMSTDISAIPQILSFCNFECMFGSDFSLAAYLLAQGHEGGPINTATGVYDYSVKDLSIPTPAGNLTFYRTYSSFSLTRSDTFAPGWVHNHDSRLIFPDDPEGVPGKVLLKAHTANLFIFDDNGDGTYTAYPGVTAKLVQDPGPPVTYTVTNSQQSQYVFDEDGRILTFTNAQGNGWNYVYDATSGNLERIEADGGSQYLSLQYDQGRINVVSDHTGRSVTYQYDAVTGELTSVVDVTNETWLYEYNDPNTAHLLTRVAAPGNVTVESTDYFADGRAWKQFDGEGHLVVELTYNADGTTTITDALGNEKTHIYDERETLIDETMPYGGTSKQYDFNFRPGKITDALENITTLHWSDDGSNLERIKDALGYQTDISYGDFNNLTSINDNLGYETRYTYGDTNFPTLPTRVEYFDGSTTYIGTDYEYYQPDNPEGQPAGKVKFETDALGHQTYYTYTSTGQTEAVTSAYGTANALTTSYQYDDLGHLTHQTDPVGVVTYNEYDAASRLTKTIQNYDLAYAKNEDNVYNIWTQYVYDLRGNQIAMIDTNDVITRTYYDLNNRPLAVVQNLYVNGDLSDIDLPLTSIPGYSSSFPDRNVRTETTYDEAGNVIVTTDSQGIMTRTFYDQANRPEYIFNNWDGIAIPPCTPTASDQNVCTRMHYDDNGNLIATEESDGTITRTYHDELNRPVTVVQNLVNQDIYNESPPNPGALDENVRTDTIYDGNGNVIATFDPGGIITRTYYDAMNRPVTVVQNFTGPDLYDNENIPERISGETDANIRTDIFYDEAGNVIATQDPLGVVTRTYYDEANRPVTVVRNLDLVNYTIYDTTPPVRGSGDPDQNVRTDTVYDQNGRKEAAIDPLGRETRNEYDAAGRLKKVTQNYASGQAQNYLDQFNIVMEYTYTALGQQSTQTDTLGRVTQNAYDSLGRLEMTTRNYLDGQIQNYEDPSGDWYNLVTSYAYDSQGNQIGVTDTTGVTTRTYFDGLYRPTVVVRNLVGQDIYDAVPPARENPPDTEQNLRVDTIYNSDGTVGQVIDESGISTSFEYDGLKRQDLIIDAENNTTQYKYDASGNLLEMVDGNTVTTKYEYDAVGRLKTVIENYQDGVSPNHETNVRTEYFYDANGNRRRILDGKGHETTFTYDAFGRIKTESDALLQTNTYEYDAVGNRVSLVDANGITIIYDYDELDRLELIDYPDPEVDVTFDYDPLGRREFMTDGVGNSSWIYNNLDRPISIIDPFSAEVRYEYDENGNREVLTYPGGQTVSYLFNDLNQLETVSGGGLTGNVTYEYDATGRLKEINRPNGVNTVYEYYDNGWLESLTHATASSTLSSFIYQYDNVGNRTQVDEDLTIPGESAALLPSFESDSTYSTRPAFMDPTPLPTSEVYMGMSHQADFIEKDLNPAPFSPAKVRSDYPRRIAGIALPTFKPVTADTTATESNPTLSLAAKLKPAGLPFTSDENSKFTVNSIGDNGDSDLEDGICNDGTNLCTLRAAIEQANANLGRDTILFALPGESPYVIQPLTPLPAIKEPLVIDGESQPGFKKIPIIVLDGSQAGDGSDGLHIASGGSVVRGLVINQFSYCGIRLDGEDGNKIEGNFIGTDVIGMNVDGNLIGILIDGSSGNLVGGATLKERNLISGNGIGIYVHGNGATGNRVLGNLIGVDINGKSDLGNDIGVRIQKASGNFIGGQDDAEKNLVVDNAYNLYLRGIEVSDNEIQANLLVRKPERSPDLNFETDTRQKNDDATHEAGIDSPPGMMTWSNQMPGASSTFSPISLQTTSSVPAPLAAGKTFTVNSRWDGADADTTDGVCSTASGKCTLRAAIQQANYTAAKDTIEFNLPGSTSSDLTIKPNSALPTITKEIVIDGTTQPGFNGTPIIRLNGSMAGLGVNGLKITAGSSTVKGLVIRSFDNNGIKLATNGGNIIQGNYIGTNASGSAAYGNGWIGIYVNKIPNNKIGGTASGAGNLISGNFADGVYIFGAASTGNKIRGNHIGTNAAGSAAIGNDIGVSIQGAPGNQIGGTNPDARNVISGNYGGWGILISGAGASDNIVLGNYIGTNADGTTAMGNSGWGILLDEAGSNNVIGGTTTTARNLISGNGDDGILINYGAGSSIIQGNYIGTDLTGMSDLGNGLSGIEIAGSPNNTIGGTIIGAGNLISGNEVDGIRLTYSESSGNIIQGNKVGTNADGVPNLGNDYTGILIFDGSNNTIGGSSAAAGNLVAGNIQEGIVVSSYQSPTTGNLIQNNLIWANGGIGIDLRPNGVTPNDPGDADSGPNNLQNFPILTSAIEGANTTISGTLNSEADKEYLLEFYANTQCDPTGYGEGQTYLGSKSVTTDASGNASFEDTLPASTRHGQFVSATATDPDGNTSEFSACMEVSQFPIPPGPITITYDYDPLNRLTAANYSYGAYYTYTYDAVGNRLTQASHLGTNSYGYDDANRLIDLDGVTYTWDANGNLLSDGMNTYAYDSANRLVSITGNSNATFAYNGLGDRLLQNGVQYTLDLNAGLTQVLDDGTNTYLYGMGRIAEQQGGANEYFLGDALGSVRQVVDDGGSVALVRSYSPYGETAYNSGTAQTDYGFTNEYTSQGLIYLRARHYAPEIGRFLTRDTWGGDYKTPLSLNRWNYVEGNPVNLADPSGHHYNNVESLPDRRDLTDWLPSAAVYMATDPEILEIRRLISSTDGVQNIKGFLKFKSLVQAGARFDVKLKIKDRLGRSIKLGENWYEYSAPGNILYGFYGSAAGVKGETLHLGAGYAQVKDVLVWIWEVGYLCEDNPDEFPDFGGPMRYFDTPDDYHAVDFGIWLYQRYYVPSGIFTRGNFVQGLNSYEFVWGLRGKLNPGDYQPNATGPYPPDYFDQ